MTKTETPLLLWDFCYQYTIELRNRIARPLQKLNGRTPYELMTGNTPDISEFLEFSWYQPVWYYEPAVFPQQTKHLVRWLGVAHRVGQAMCYWLLPISGVPIVRTTIESITQTDLMTENIKSQLSAFDLEIDRKIRNQADQPASFRLYREDEDDTEDLDDYGQTPMDPKALQPDIDNIPDNVFDDPLLTEPILPREGQSIRAKIVGRKRDRSGNLIGRYNPNPFLNTRIYTAEFPDGHVQEYSANAVIEAIYDQVDEEGYDQRLFWEIIDHRVSSPMYLNPSIQTSHRSFTTKGWEIFVSWQDGSTSWHPLGDIKNSYPIQLAKYAIAHQLDGLPVFSLWVKHTVKKEKRLIKAIKSKYSQRSHKFGIYVPRTVQEALEIEKQTNTTYWREAIQKEMTNNKMAFKEEDESIPIGYKWIKCHMNFDVKMDFTRKA